tara:strand:- start:424 stop:825 length:402 start_codon:yes stop_codon:yes gene_type:complete
VKLHHIGIVCNETDMNKFFFKPKKKFIYNDKIQNNKLIIEHNIHNNLWMEFVIPKNKKSTVYKYLIKNGPGIHHFGYKVNNILDQKKKLTKKKGFLYINSFETNISCFGGLIKTMFFFNNNFFIELLSNVKKK